MPVFSAESRVEAVQVGELPCVRLVCSHAEALIALQGAQLLRYQPVAQRPVVWLSEQAVFKRGQPLRGGVPVCWPWFGDLSRNPLAVQTMVHGAVDAPAHGLVRAQDWEMVDASGDEESVAAVFRFTAPAGFEMWRHAAVLDLRVHLGKSLNLELSTRNPGASPVAITQALHTYFAVSDSRRVSVTGLEDADYLDTLDNWTRKTQDGLLRIEGETDRLYLGLDRPLVIQDESWQRDIHLTFRDSRSAIVWNPWVEKSKRLSQFADDAWQDMLCIETARVWDDLLVVAPGETGRMSVDIRVQTRL